MGDLLLMVMQIVGGGVIGFFAGVWLGRKQICPLRPNSGLPRGS